jgi:uncharacterized linocin/CFP29 family protein
MADNNMQLQWTDDQWNKVRQVVYEEARKARVAGNVLPLYGPLDPDASYVSQQTITEQDVQATAQQRRVLSIDDTETLRLSTLQVEVFLRSSQVADPELSSALIAFRRAANILARLEDEIIFRGQPGPGQGPTPLPSRTGARLPPSRVAPRFQVLGGEQTPGLLGAPGRLDRVVPPVVPVPAGRRALGAGAGPRSEGEALVEAISGAIGALEENYHLGPFACVLDQVYFTAVQSPNDSLVLPQDRILPFLGGGALMRSSALPERTGLVIALGGAPIDLVVATDISVKFLQVTVDPFFVFRVYEKIVLRINQEEAIAHLRV